MTNAQMTSLTVRMDKSDLVIAQLKSKINELEQVLAAQTALLQTIAQNKVDVTAIEAKIDKLQIIVNSIRDEEEA